MLAERRKENSLKNYGQVISNAIISEKQQKDIPIIVPSDKRNSVVAGIDNMEYLISQFRNSIENVRMRPLVS